jgi:hypothetical protein
VNTNIHELRAFTQRVRYFLEPLWFKAHENWNDEPFTHPTSKHMCRYTCLFLKKVLKDNDFGEWTLMIGRPSRLEEGSPAGKYGYKSLESNWYDHAWLVKDNLFIDITADQFGDECVQVGEINFTNYRANLSENDVITSLQKLKKRVDGWLDIWASNLILE